MTPGHRSGTSTRPPAQRGGGLPGRRSRSSKGRQGPGTGLLILEEGEASGLPHDLHRDQRRQGAGGGAEPGERRGVPQVLERRLGGPPGLMKNFKLRLSPITAVSHFF